VSEDPVDTHNRHDICTSSESECALPNKAPADAVTNARPEVTSVSRVTVRARRDVYMSVTALSRLNK
jgi:hypothetical protein